MKDDRRLVWLAGGLFFLSGAGSLIYELVWVKLLALQFGSSAWSISTVVAAFMAGLGAGSAWAGRRADRLERPFRVYAWLELAIAVFGLLSLPLLSRLDAGVAPLYHAFAGRFALFVLARFLLAFAVLLLPAFLMGASLPVLVCGLAGEESFRERVAWLYGTNTLGGAAGVVAAGFWMLPRLHVAGTLGVAVGLGLVVFALALHADRRFPAAQRAPAAPTLAGTGRPPWLLLLALLVAGGLGVFYEVAWTRLLAPVVGSSTYAFSIILATFLCGIGAGSLLAASPLAPRQAYRAGVGLALAGASLAVAGGLFAVNQLPGWFVALAHRTGDSTGLLFAAQGLLTGLLVLPPTIAMGAALPLAIAGWRAETGAAGRAVGGIYAANTAGSIAGSLLAGFVVLPRIGAPRSILAGAVLGLLVGLTLLASERQLAARHRALWAAAVTAGLLLLAGLAPRVDLAALHQGVFRPGVTAAAEGELLYLADGTGATVTVYRSPSNTYLKVNGKPDASTGADLTNQYLLGHLPALLGPPPSTACVIGYGSGATVAALAAHPELARIDCIELEQAVIGASAYFETINERVLDDPRVRLYIEDGRTFLRYRRRRYDLIVSEPSNPWIAGVAALFTREYYQAARARLLPGGRFCQWIQVYELSRHTLDVMLSTLADVFGHVTIWIHGGDLICVASTEPLAPPARLAARMRQPAVARTLARIGIEQPHDLFAGYLASFPEDLPSYTPADGTRNTDRNLWLEYRAPIEMYRGTRLVLQRPGGRLWLERIAARFFTGEPRASTALGLARALERLYPESSPLVSGMAATLDLPELRELADRASRRAAERLATPQRLERARALFGERRHDEAARLLRQVVACEPRNHEAHRQLGRCYQKLRRPEPARRHLQEAIRLEPLDYLAHAALGDTNRALSLNPLFWIRRAIEQRRYRKALELLERTRRLLPADQFRALDASVRALLDR